MSNNLTASSGGDDGFFHGFVSDRLIRGQLLRWNDAQHWTDRDGLAAPTPLLVVAVNDALQRWRNDKPTVIVDKPLPDPDALNSAIPFDEWKKGVDGKPRPPWAHVVVVYFIDPAVGNFYTFVSSTVGGHIAFDQLQESVTGMRMLRGGKVLPLVALVERPMKTQFGIRTRPHFEVIDWKEPASFAAQQPALATLLAASAPEAKPEATPEAKPEATPKPEAAAPASRRKRDLAAETLARMGAVKPAASSEGLNDSIPW